MCVCKAMTVDPPQKQLWASCTNHLSYLCVFDCVCEREGELNLFDQVSHYMVHKQTNSPGGLLPNTTQSSGSQ